MKVYYNRKNLKCKYLLQDLNMDNIYITKLIENIVNNNLTDEFNKLVLDNMLYVLDTKISSIDIAHNQYTIDGIYLSLNNMCTGEKYVFITTLFIFTNVDYCISNITTVLYDTSLVKYNKLFKNQNVNLLLNDYSHYISSLYKEGLEYNATSNCWE